LAINCAKGCVRDADFIDKNHIVANTLEQVDMTYSKDNKNIEWDAFYIEASVYEDQYTNNRVALYYYEEPTFDAYLGGETPANIQTEVFIGTHIAARDLDKVRKYG